MTATAVLDHVRATSRRDRAADAALAWLAEHGFPTRRDEAWRYTAVGELLDSLSASEPAPAHPTTPAVLASLAGRAATTLRPRLVMVDGRLDAGLSDLAELPEGVSVSAETRAATVVEDDDPADGFEAVNRAGGLQVVVVTARPGAHGGPLHVVHLAGGGAGGGAHPSLTHPRTEIHAAPGSRLEVVEVFEGPAGPAFTNAVTSIDAGAGAEVSHRRAQLEGPDTSHVGRTSARLGPGASLHLTAVDVGAARARHSIDVRLDHRDAAVELAGLHVAAGSQHHDTSVEVHHRASGCRSSQLFKGALGGRARGSFTGRVVVAADTTGTDASQLNHNLVLSPSAQADSRPWLEIFSDDVRCTHGATVGRLDEEATFYLRSRGIPHEVARSMLVDAFVAEIVDAGLGPQVGAHVAAAIAAKHEELT